MTRDEVLELRCATGSDVGRRRSGNEDSALTTPRLLAVADGMGGHAAGEVASAIAIDAVRDLDARLEAATTELSPTEELAAVYAAASGVLDERVAADPELAGMGTTLTAILWLGSEFALGHIGDSRAYRLREAELTQLSRDHTLVQSLVDEGKLDEETAAVHPARSVLIKALLAGQEAEPDVDMHEAREGDRYLLCSDGLSDVVSPDEIGKVLGKGEDPADAVATLIELANEAGGPDNITCVVVHVLAGSDGDSGSGSEPDAAESEDGADGATAEKSD
ncbi:protein phosphatase [Saccharomonospora sp. CUA-673]|uniref:PP2C family protein-serine/threonine phosphatase n=1 Tax=Saccharomonospora sp. CUA-673 TaxID=1904969 RepID=UPI000964ECCC|nr:protein phosphatase 2C domain-containing protein [Saccharomonospora sp. CUA-673]OLT46952.1 protein phosphatase [Saccharomonospora sp. CUA-673]